MQIIAHDYETTGVDPRTCGVVQSAIAIVEMDSHGNWDVLAREVELHHPGCLIPDAAARIHGVTNQDVAGLPDYEASLQETFEQAFSEFEPTGVVGYNSNRYDNIIARRVGMPAEGLIEIDMMVAANRLMNDGHLERARLVDAYEGLVGKPAENAHDALADVTMTLELVQPVMAIKGFESVADLIGWLEKPEANPEMRMPFGKHKGIPLNAVPGGYLRWLSKNADLQDDLRLSIQEVLG